MPSCIGVLQLANVANYSGILADPKRCSISSDQTTVYWHSALGGGVLDSCFHQYVATVSGVYSVYSDLAVEMAEDSSTDGTCLCFQCMLCHGAGEFSDGILCEWRDRIASWVCSACGAMASDNEYGLEKSFAPRMAGASGMDDSQLRADAFCDYIEGMEIRDCFRFRAAAYGCLSLGGMARFYPEPYIR